MEVVTEAETGREIPLTAEITETPIDRRAETPEIAETLEIAETQVRRRIITTGDQDTLTNPLPSRARPTGPSDEELGGARTRPDAHGRITSLSALLEIDK